jgi:hypothetical protein
MKKKFILMIALIIFVIILAIVGWFYFGEKDVRLSVSAKGISLVEGGSITPEYRATHPRFWRERLRARYA